MKILNCENVKILRKKLNHENINLGEERYVNLHDSEITKLRKYNKQKSKSMRDF